MLVKKSFKIIVVGGSFGGLAFAHFLRREISRRHKIILLSNNAKTTFRASFPRVVYEDLPLENITVDLHKLLKASGIEFLEESLVRIDQKNDRLITNKTKHKYDYLVIATGARHGYKDIPGSREFAKSICDPTKILDTKKAILEFRGGDVYAGVGPYTPCDGPPMEMLLDLDHRLRKLGVRNKAKLYFMTGKKKLLPPGGPKIWDYLENLFKKRAINALTNITLKKVDRNFLYFEDGKKRRYDLLLFIPPYRGIKSLEKSGLVDERGFVLVNLSTMRAEKSVNFNIYAVGDATYTDGPKQAHIAMLQAEVAASHIGWRINGKGNVAAYLPEFKCVMDTGGGTATYFYSQWLSDGEVVKIKEGKAPYLSKILFEKLLIRRRGNVGNLHRTMMK